MSKVFKRGTAMLAVMAACLVFATSALAQMPTSPWKKGRRSRRRMRSSTASPSTANSTCLAAGTGQGSGRRLRVRPGHRQMDEEDVDAAAGSPCGPGRCERQDLRDGRLRPAEGHRHPGWRRLGTH